MWERRGPSTERSRGSKDDLLLLSCLGGGDPTRIELVERDLRGQQLLDVIGHTIGMTDALNVSLGFELLPNTQPKRERWVNLRTPPPFWTGCLRS
jgi:hypothetical protein